MNEETRKQNKLSSIQAASDYDLIKIPYQRSIMLHGIYCNSNREIADAEIGILR